MLESKRKAFIFLIIAIVLAAISGYLVLQKVQDLNAKEQEIREDLGTMTPIYVASNDIKSRELITPEDIKMEEIPKEYVRSYHVTDADYLVNKVSVVPLIDGDIITRNMLKDFSVLTDQDHRLISLLRSEKVQFDERLSALDRVDIIVSHNFDGNPVTEVFMEDVKVVQVGTTSGQSEVKEDEEGEKEEPESIFTGIHVEIPFDLVPELIHMQNYADSIRIVKANVGQLKEPTNETKDAETESTGSEAEEPEQKEKNEKDKKDESKAEEKKKETEEKGKIDEE